jgi:predicted amidophosphoribosyltransferase
MNAFEASLVSLNRKVKDQALLNLEEREENLTGAMAAAPFQRVSGRLIDDSRRNVVLVDDVVTTGATLREMHRALLEAGWNPLFFVTFAETL